MKLLFAVLILSLINQIYCFDIRTIEKSCNISNLEITQKECVYMMTQISLEQLYNNQNCSLGNCRIAFDICKNYCSNDVKYCSVCMKLMYDNCNQCIKPSAKNEHCCQIDSQWGYCSICCNPGQGALCQTKNWPPCRCL